MLRFVCFRRCLLLLPLWACLHACGDDRSGPPDASPVAEAGMDAPRDRELPDAREDAALVEEPTECPPFLVIEPDGLNSAVSIGTNAIGHDIRFSEGSAFTLELVPSGDEEPDAGAGSPEPCRYTGPVPNPSDYPLMGRCAEDRSQGCVQSSDCVEEGSGDATGPCEHYASGPSTVYLGGVAASCFAFAFEPTESGEPAVAGTLDLEAGAMSFSRFRISPMIEFSSSCERCQRDSSGRGYCGDSCEPGEVEPGCTPDFRDGVRRTSLACLDRRSDGDTAGSGDEEPIVYDLGQDAATVGLGSAGAEWSRLESLGDQFCGLCVGEWSDSAGVSLEFASDGCRVSSDCGPASLAGRPVSSISCVEIPIGGCWPFPTEWDWESPECLYIRALAEMDDRGDTADGDMVTTSAETRESLGAPGRFEWVAREGAWRTRMVALDCLSIAPAGQLISAVGLPGPLAADLQWRVTPRCLGESPGSCTDGPRSREESPRREAEVACTPPSDGGAPDGGVIDGGAGDAAAVRRCPSSGVREVSDCLSGGTCPFLFFEAVGSDFRTPRVPPARGQESCVGESTEDDGLTECGREVYCNDLSEMVTLDFEVTGDLLAGVPGRSRVTNPVMYIRRGDVGMSARLCGDFLESDSEDSECWASDDRNGSMRPRQPLIQGVTLAPGETVTVFVAGRGGGNTVGFEIRRTTP